MSRVYISLGSNLGDREKNIKEAIRIVSGASLLPTKEPKKKINVVKISSIYETEPVGFKEQNWFLNAVIEIETTLSPQELLVVLQQVESKLDKKIERKWGPRTIDLDILLYDDIILDSPDLQIPHKLMHERAFVLIPLVQIAPNIKHPVLNKTSKELVDELIDDNKVYLNKLGLQIF